MDSAGIVRSLPSGAMPPVTLSPSATPSFILSRDTIPPATAPPMTLRTDLALPAPRQYLAPQAMLGLQAVPVSGWGISSRGTPLARTWQDVPAEQATSDENANAYKNHDYGDPAKGYLPMDHLSDLHDFAKGMTMEHPGLVKMFPSAFLMFCIGIFAVPIVLVVHLSMDPSVQKFMPQTTWLVFMLPASFVLTFIVHLAGKGRPSKFFITLTLIGSCLLLLVLSDIFLIAAYQKAPIFASSDCVSWPEKRKMQDDWELARGFYATCMSEKSKSEKISFAAAAAAYRMQDCKGYDEAVKSHPEWAYLRALEETQNCAGWCTPDQPMWSTLQTKDACSPVVASIFRDKVEWCMKQVCYYTLFALIVICVILVVARPLLAKYGLEL